MSSEHREYNIRHAKIETLLEPVSPLEFGNLTAHMELVLHSLSEMGFRASTGYMLEYSEANLGWRRVDSLSGFGESIIHGWIATDESAQYEGELRAIGKPFENARRIRLEIPGNPATTIRISSRSFLDPLKHAEVAINIGNYAFDFVTGQQNRTDVTLIKCKKRTIDGDKQVTFHHIGRYWQILEVGQRSLISSRIYEPLAGLYWDIAEFNRQSLINPDQEILTLLLQNIFNKLTAVTVRLKVNLDERKQDILRRKILVGIKPRDFVKELLEETELPVEEQKRLLAALEADTDLVLTPLGETKAFFKVRKSSARGSLTGVQTPKIATGGQIKGLDNYWRSYITDLVKSELVEYIILDSKLYTSWSNHLPNIRILITNGVDFPEDRIVSRRGIREPGV